MPKLVLFDIDGTLVLTGGAGIRAMNRAGKSVLGISQILDGIKVAGRTDWVIFHDALTRMGRELSEEVFARLRDEHVANLREEILLPGQGVKAVMPGVQQLLPALQSRADIFLGLLTGNFYEAARIKLEHFDLWHYFVCGAFGDDSANRNDLVPFALERARACGLPPFAVQDVLVVGDTPNDVACAKAVGALPIAVATGTYTVDELRDSGAQNVFQDLSDVAAFVRVLDSEPVVGRDPGGALP